LCYWLQYSSSAERLTCATAWLGVDGLKIKFVREYKWLRSEVVTFLFSAKIGVENEALTREKILKIQ
jgi:hypothetical protein